MDETEPVSFICFRVVGTLQLRNPSLFGGINVMKEKGVISWLGTEDVAKIVVHQLLDMRCIRTQAILHNDDLQVGMLPA